jgi:hypothetical protein
MTVDMLRREIEEALQDVPLFDVHSHHVVSTPGARGLHDVLLYHMIVSDLYAAGCPSGARLAEFPAEPNATETDSRVIEALPYLTSIRNTSTAWALRTILADLYGWRTELTRENWRQLDGLIRERANDPVWAHSVLDRAGIDRVTTEYARRDAPDESGRFQYSLEWAFFTRTQWGEFDTPLYELERCWGGQIGSPTPISHGVRPPTDRVVRTLDDVVAAVAYYVDVIPFEDVVAVTTHFSTDIELREVSDAEMERALGARSTCTAVERDVYASYVNEAFLNELERRRPNTLVQFSLGAEPLPHESASRVSQRTLRQIGEMIARHPTLRFQCFLASRHANQTVCTLARGLPNLSVAGYWWHNFFPDAMRQVMSERLDMLPVNRQIGFFSDAYCVEWAYAKAVIVRRQLAQVLAERVAQSQFELDDAVSIARSILWESPRELNGLEPWDRDRWPLASRLTPLR